MTEKGKLQQLGERLRQERLRRNETQAVLAARIGISVPTLRKMEAGDPGVLMGHWNAALKIFDREGDWDAVLAAPEDLFAKYDRVTRPLPHRARRRRI